MNQEKSAGALVRPASFADAEAIGRLLARNSMDVPTPAFFRETWESYPFEEEFRDVPIGWVLESGGEIVGSLGGVHTLYELGERRIKALTTTAWVVDVGHRNKSMNLLTAFFRQKGLDLWLDGSANITASRVLTGLRIPRIPTPRYSTPCFWAVRPWAFARAALVRRRIPAAGLLAWPAGFVMRARDILLGGGRARPYSPVRRLPEFDERFDAFWQRLRLGPPRLRAVRTRAVLAWRFRSEIREKRAVILAVEHGGTLSGYAVLVRRQVEGVVMNLYDVADLQAIGDEPATLTDLLLASMEAARDDGVDAVKFLSGTPGKRAPAERLHPYTYNLPLWQLYYRTASPDLGTALASPDVWDFSLFDTY